MEHLDHENLSLYVLFTFSTCHRYTCLLLSLVLSPVFQIAVTQPHSKSPHTEPPAIFLHSFSASLFSSSGIHQFHHLDGCQAMDINYSFIFAFWALIPSVYSLLCYKPIWDKLQREEVISHHLIAHYLLLKMIRDIFQPPWVYFNNLGTHFLCLKTIRDIHQ